MTINVTPALYDQIERLARALQLEVGATARMLIVEALARRELYPKVRPLPKRKRRYRAKADKARPKTEPPSSRPSGRSAPRR